ncbi:F-box protein [Acorus gramineus]|uniref:F-box protein n=1 Tax=Acorus gramineus TaxID=55184 RepID=A0AAV9AX06_ACOGR|nr:F-box protein [Acorus gramineus]
MGLKIGGNIERVNGKELSYGDFVNRYLKKNEPVLLTGLMEGWRSCRDWVTHDGLPNLHFFSTHFGKSKVQVADCGTREFTDQKRVEMSVSEFVSHWMELSSGEHSNCFCCNVKEWRLLYLKDWHFVKTTWLECTQEINEIIFVPSGWYHQVLNMEDTISINHNWFNGYNLSWVWNLLVKDYNEAREYIDDIRDISDDFEGLCQRNLAANTVVLDMKSVEAFSKGDSGEVLHPNYNIKGISEAPEFAELCGAIDRAYTLINEQCLINGESHIDTRGIRYVMILSKDALFHERTELSQKI